MAFSPPSLSTFFVFTPKNVAEGKEHEKILFFHPASVSEGDKNNQIGLSEALVNFTGKFSPNEPCDTAHFEKTTWGFLHPEKDYWMTIIVKNPSAPRMKDNKPVTEYKQDISDTSIHQVLSQAYRLFRLFNGSMESIVQEQSEAVLKEKLEFFFSKYVQTLRFENVDLFNTLEGIQFLPVDRNIYLRIQCFINAVENTFQNIRYSSFLYRDLAKLYLVWSGLEQEDMRTLYYFLQNHLYPHLFDNALPMFFKVNKFQEGFVVGPPSLTEWNYSGQVPSIFIGPKGQKFSLVVFQFREITCVFLVEPSSTNDMRFFQSLSSFITSQIDFSSILVDYFNLKKQGLEDQYRYIYFNQMNLALKTSLKDKGALISQEVMTMLDDIHSDFEKSSEMISEVLIRNQEDQWVVGRKSDQREFYVIFEHKNSHLIEINEEVRKLSSTYFNNIFIN